MHDSTSTVLLVEDDVDLAQLIANYLAKHGYSVSTLHRGDIALSEIPIRNPEIVILDLMLPGLDGLSVCRQVRPHYDGPILMLTALSGNVDIVAGLETGADDYLAKPVDPRVLLARVRSLLRRVKPVEQSNAGLTQITLPRFSTVICSSSRTLKVHGENIDLSTKEFDLLWLLASQAGTVVSRDDIYQQLRGMPFDGVDRSMDIRISKLRKCLRDNPDNPKIIKTVRGRGYLLVADA